MAKIKYNDGIEQMTGALSKKGLVQRQKHLHDYNGNITKTCRVEAYKVEHPRNFKNRPAIGAELAHQTSFGEASKIANELLRAFKRRDTLTPEQLLRFEDFKRRFDAQLKGKPDRLAPRDAHGVQKIYYGFDHFVRAIIYHELNSPAS